MSQLSLVRLYPNIDVSDPFIALSTKFAWNSQWKKVCVSRISTIDEENKKNGARKVPPKNTAACEDEKMF